MSNIFYFKNIGSSVFVVRHNVGSVIVFIAFYFCKWLSKLLIILEVVK